MVLKSTHKLAERLFGDRYTIERREFADGDARTIIKHNTGWSSTCYVQVLIWVQSADVWVEYYEDDTRRCREILEYEDFDPDADMMRYIYPDE